MTYSLLNLPFLAVAVALLVVAALRLRRGRATRNALPAIAVALLGVLLLTAVFDNVIIGLGVVDYDPDHFTGLRVGLAPVEDFAYAIAAGIGLPALWLLLPARDERR